MNPPDETISVLLPVHGGVHPQHLQAALDSIQRQTRRADEVVIVEDGPLAAKHLTILDTFEGAHPAVTRVRLTVNRGAGVANQAGLAAATGKWIAKADADDINLEHRFEAQIAAVGGRGLDVCGAAMGEFDGDPQRVLGIRRNPTSHEQISRRMRLNNPINHPTAFYRRQLALDAGGYPEMRYMQDYDLFARMLLGGAVMGNGDEVLVLFRADAAMLSRRRVPEYRALEAELQRNLRLYGIVGPLSAARNRLLRRAFRAMPAPLMRRVYAAVFQHRSLHHGSGRAQT